MAFADAAPTIPRLLRELVARHGERPFILLNDRRISYAEAEAESARLARGLLASGVGKGTRVGVLFPNGPDWVVAFLAATRIGAVAVPLNTFCKPRELGWVLRHADVHTLLATARLLGNDYLERLEKAAPSLSGRVAQGAGPGPPDGGALWLPELPHLRAVYVWGDARRPWTRPGEALAAAGDAPGAPDADLLAAVEAEVAPADPVVLIYSSGSTADPKGAVHSHGTLIRHSQNLNAYRDVTGDDRVFSPMPFFWVGGLVYSLFSAMHVGAFLLCEEAFDAGRTLALLERERATIVAGWPHYAKAMQDHPSFGSRDLSAVRAGNLYALLPPETRPADPELRSNSLGMTETCGPHTIDRMDVDLPESLRGSFGRAVPGLEHKVVDPGTGAALGPGEVGEICVRGYSVLQSLHKVEREQTFDADGFYHTGDAGYLDADGHLFFQARLGEMIKTAGANVSPREVEVALEALPGVQCAFVVGIPHPDRGQNVAAAIVPERGASLDADGVRACLSEELSAYKLPRHCFFCEKEALPFTDSGKIDRRRLVAWMRERGVDA